MTPNFWTFECIYQFSFALYNRSLNYSCFLKVDFFSLVDRQFEFDPDYEICNKAYFLYMIFI